MSRLVSGVNVILECVRLLQLQSSILPLIPEIYDILNQEEGVARFLPVQMKARFMCGQVNWPSLSRKGHFISSLLLKLGLIYPLG